MTTSDAVAAGERSLDAYLERLGFGARPRPSIETLRELHRRHVSTVPYENLAIMLGRPPSVDPRRSQDRVAATGRAGYCFHHNGAFEAALVDLGFAVERRHGHVWFNDDAREEADLNHLALVVTGLPSADCADGRWWVDVGLGDALIEPLPLVEGRHEQSGFRYRLEDVTEQSWTFLHDPAAHSFTGSVVRSLGADRPAVRAAHARLSTPPDGVFTRFVVAQRRDAAGIDALRCCLLVHTEPGGQEETVVASYDDWRGALVDVLGVQIQPDEEGEMRGLHERMWAAHVAWDAQGRPRGYRSNEQEDPTGRQLTGPDRG